MQNSIPKPKLLDEWLSLLDNTRLPVPAGDKRRVSSALDNRQNNLGDIARVISSSPSIALILFREANKQQNSFSRPAQHMEGVLTRLGINRCKELLGRLQETPEQQIPRGLRQLWLISEHANTQANALFAVKMSRLWQEIHWGSLLFLSPLWPLVTRYPSLFGLWERRVLGDRESQSRVEQELFGASLSKLSQALAAHWSLPEWIGQAYHIINDNQQLLARTMRVARLHDQVLLQQQALDEQKNIYMWYRQPANSIIIVNGLAIGAHYSWSHEHCLRWQRFASLFLGRPLDLVQNQIHQNAVEHARKTGTSELWHPAQALLWPWGSKRIRPAASNGNPAKKATANLQLWQQLARKMLQQPSPFSNHAALLAAFEQLLKHAGLARCAIISINSRSGKLQPIYQQGFAFRVHQSLSQDSRSALFHRVITSKKPLLVQPQNLSRLKELLDQETSAAITSSNFILGSIQLKDKPVMLLIADNQDQQLGSQELKGFASSCRYFEQALAIISQAD